ncbi:MAG: sulfur oxidation c-type cytochrome SoxX [Gallionellales bacterium 35-53-114]|jgi:sulfur-oxidizing protein SoxX|nr:MAG: sulfur oxidation c-type cytochrome SoxX [Gallionellales bacterium 35-53-114]OYZ62705.1 MAG: sulfur oxidation c-type cytochrome SoxX [Gallionellales bacterium 24-53-125]OZB09781.1 MAG: sulfur oxidation c-type cytochrome SoxX [Gallionellales bacterium 39-52-133]HQS57656.1 sulfur oxidation c-type cytochrome SoxX [Gallionellaceae bacterium]HQS74110.1 sulfur oxidation c-type cytochrome SoxX [Gallionellaceae bacterium]
MKKIIFLAILSMLMLQGCKTTPGSSAAAPAADAKKEAKPLEMDPKKLFSSSGKGMGNCTACHAIPADEKLVAGDIGPPMIGMKSRFPDIEKLKAAIADQKVFAPDTIMPPFGRNKLLTPEQIDVIAQYIYQY